MKITKISVHSGHLNPAAPAGQPNHAAASECSISRTEDNTTMTNEEIIACLTAHPELIPEVMKILTSSKPGKTQQNSK